MDEVGEQELRRASGTGRGGLIALGVAGLVGLIAVAVVIVASRMGSGAMASEPTTATTSASPTASAPSTVAPLPNQLSAFNTRVLFGVQSVGSDISKGVIPAFKKAKLPKPKVMGWGRALKTKGPLFAVANIGKNGSANSKLKAFAALVNDAPRGSVNVALMAFNYQDVTAESDIDSLLQGYQATMESVEEANPDITFLYTTVPVTSSNSWRETDPASLTGLRDGDQPVWQDNVARERLNTVLRDRYETSGRLFDIAALQAQLERGKVCAKKQGKEWYHVMNPALAINGKGLNDTGSVRLARELLRLIEAVQKA